MPKSSHERDGDFDHATARRARAAEACLSCRKRKIRCNVYQAQPCTNCVSEKFTCELAPRVVRSDRHKTLRKKLPEPAPGPLEAAVDWQAADDKGYDDVGVTEVVQSDFSSTDKFWDISSMRELRDEQDEEELRDYHDYSNGDAAPCDFTMSLSTKTRPGVFDPNIPDFVQLFNRSLQRTGIDLDLDLDLLSQSRDSSALKEVIHAIHSCQHGLSDQLKTVRLLPQLMLSPTHATIRNPLSCSQDPPTRLRGSWSWFQNYPFLDDAALERLEPTDLSYLRESGALHLPSRTAVNVFVKEYFLHVHPMLPMIGERSFWKALNCIADDCGRSNVAGISLFLFQALLAASSIYVPLDILQNCGFLDYQAARHAFCRSASLLYDFYWEKNSLVLTQGALLLSLTSSNDDPIKGNSFWLMTAVRNVRNSKAMAALDESPESRLMWRKVWWCCILRDRLISLGSRRPLCVTMDTFNAARNPGLTIDDFTGEADDSLVYDRRTKLRLRELFLLQLQFATQLSEMLSLTYPPDGSPVPRITCLRDYSALLSRSQECKKGLQRWFEKFTHHCFQWRNEGNFHGSLLLFVHLMSMAYHTATIMLHHYEVMTFYFHPAFVNSWIEQRLTGAREAISGSVFSISRILRDLSQRNLHAKLDMQGPSYCFLPLKMLELGLKLSPLGDGQCSLSNHVQQMTATLNMYKERWDGIERVLERMTLLLPYDQRRDTEKVVTLKATGPFEPQPTAEQQSGPAIESAFCENFKNNTAQYIQMTTALNLCIAKGRHVAVDDLPEQFRPGSNMLHAKIQYPATFMSSTVFDPVSYDPHDIQNFSDLVNA